MIGNHVADYLAVDHHVVTVHVAFNRSPVAQHEQRLAAGLAADVALHVTVEAQSVGELKIARDAHVVRDQCGELCLLDARGFFLAEHKYSGNVEVCRVDHVDAASASSGV